jgi:hypothetical protein
MLRILGNSPVRGATRILPRRVGGWATLLLLLAGWVPAGTAFAMEALILGQDASIHEVPNAAAKVIKKALPGETYGIVGRRSGKGQPLYVFDDRGGLWVKVRAGDDLYGYVRTDLISVAREEYRSPRGNPLLIVNLRPTANGDVDRDLWLVQNDWQQTRRLASIEGRPIWASHGEWFICQVDSTRPVRDDSMDRTIEWIKRYSADGRARNLLAAGSYPILHEARREVYFYRDVNEVGLPVPAGLFAVSLDGKHLRPVFMLPSRHRFWKEDGDFFVQASPPILYNPPNRITLSAFDPLGIPIRFTVTLDGQLIEFRTE